MHVRAETRLDGSDRFGRILPCVRRLLDECHFHEPNAALEVGLCQFQADLRSEAAYDGNYARIGQRTRYFFIMHLVSSCFM